MKKKLFVIVLLGLFLLGITGCSDSANSGQEENNLSIEELIWNETMNHSIYYLEYSNSTYRNHEITKLNQTENGKYDVDVKVSYVKENESQKSFTTFSFVCDVDETAQEVNCKKVK